MPFVLRSEPTQLLACSTWSFPSGKWSSKTFYVPSFPQGLRRRPDRCACLQRIWTCLQSLKEQCNEMHVSYVSQKNRYNNFLVRTQAVCAKSFPPHKSFTGMSARTINWTATYSNSHAVTSPSCSWFRIHHVCLLDKLGESLWWCKSRPC